MSSQFDELAEVDWFTILPARSLAHHVESISLRRTLLELPAHVGIAEVLGSLHHGPTSQADPNRRSLNHAQALARAGAHFRRCIRSRSITAIRPAGPSWIVPDPLGFKLEGQSRLLQRRRARLMAELVALSNANTSEQSLKRAIGRVVDLLSRLDAHPHWLYWLSPPTVSLVRRTAQETLREINREAATALNHLGFDCTISTWQAHVGVVSRRLPLGVVAHHCTSRRGKGFLRRAEALGIRTLGGLAVASKDSVHFLSHVRLPTLQRVAYALKDAHPARAS